jgi:ethanolamine utilization protein EutN
MIAAVVTGNIWSTRRVDGVPSGAFLEVEVPETGARLVAFDVLGSGIGEHVLVVQGSVAASWFPGPPPPVDALVIGSIDREPTGPSEPTTPDRPSDRSEPTKRSNDAQ